MRSRGYFGIGIYHPKTEENIGTLWRSAQAFGASFIFTIGRRYKPQVSDTTKTWRNTPLFHFDTIEEFNKKRPREARLIYVELDEKAHSLHNFAHPQQAVYLLGAEDYGIPKKITQGENIVEIAGLPHCLNVATTGSIVMYDRMAKMARYE